jgi:hypothetical protein
LLTSFFFNTTVHASSIGLLLAALNPCRCLPELNIMMAEHAIHADYVIESYRTESPTVPVHARAAIALKNQ